MSPSITAQLLELERLSKAELLVRWQDCFGARAPQLCRAALLRQAIGWHLQTKALGGLSSLEKRELNSYTQTGTGNAMNARTQASVGTRLIRVWQNKTHQVTVLDGGYLYEGKTWKSLSAIARHITGTAWSGPVFFGLKKANAKPMGVINTKDSMENQNP